MGWTLLTVAAAAGGGLLLMRLRVPGGMLVGAILGAVLVNLTTGQAYIWPQTRVVAQVLTGAYIGCLVTTEDLRRLPRVIRPYLAVMSTFLALNLAVGFFIWRVTDLDLLTSLFCAAPGGMTDTPLIALDMGADASMVAVMQFVRMVFGMACLPSIIVLADRKIEGDQMVPEEGQGTHSLERKKAHVSLRKFLPTFAVALAAGILGKLSGVPAGTLSASLIAVIVLKFAGSAPPMPMWVRRLAQVVSGCCIGAGITRDQIFQLRQLILPALVLGANTLASMIRMSRTSMLDVLRQDYIRTARSKGASRARVLSRHALRNSLVPVITQVGISFAGCMGGAIVTETIFTIPGLGSLLINAVKSRDVPVVMGTVILVAVIVGLINLVVDLICAKVDPRIDLAA